MLRDGSRRWIVGGQREIHASILIAQMSTSGVPG